MMTREWSRKEGVFFFVVVMFVYICPLILANYVYIDDGFRSVAGDANWNSEGRFLMSIFYNVLSFTKYAPDAFPLALIMATALMAFMLSRLMWHYFQTAGLSYAIPVLPLFCSPFFLSNLNYQYDGPVMTLSIAALVFSIVFESEKRWLRASVPTFMVWIALAIYQPLLNLLFGLCCIELYRGLVNNKSLPELGAFVVRKLIQIVVALLMYLLVTSPFMGSDRKAMVGLDIKFYSIAVERFQHIESLISPVYQGSGQWFFILMLVLAVVSYIDGAVIMLKQRSGAVNKALALLLYWLVPVGLIVSLSGVMLIFSTEQNDSRLMLGVGPLLVFVLLLVRRLLAKTPAYFNWILLLPLIYALNFSYSYGRVLVAKKELENTLMYSLAYSISSNARLSALEKIYFSEDTRHYWLPASRGTVAAMPIMPYVMSANFLLMPYGMFRTGITNVDWEDAQHPASAVIESQIPPEVDNKFYSIYVFKGDGYIIMKKMQPE